MKERDPEDAKRKNQTRPSHTVYMRNANAIWRSAMRLGDILRFPKGHLEIGDSESGFFLILKGKVRITYCSRCGQQRFLLIICNDSIFNEIPSITRNNFFEFSFHCMEETQVCRFPSELLTQESFQVRYPHLIANLMQSLAKKASFFAIAACNTAFDDTTKQLCGILLKLHKEPGSSQADGLSQTEMAALLGVHPTTIARVLRTLREQDLVGRVSKRALEIFDAEGLRLRAGEEESA